MAAVVIGVGNPVLCDDSVGLRVAREVARLLPAGAGAETREIYGGGLRLMEALAGYELAIVIDAITGTGARPGTVHKLTLDHVMKTRNTCSSHDSNLEVALEFGRMAGIPLPSRVSIWAIEAGDVTAFTEDLTGDVERAVPGVVQGVLEELRRHQEGKCA